MRNRLLVLLTALSVLALVLWLRAPNEREVDEPVASHDAGNVAVAQLALDQPDQDNPGLQAAAIAGRVLVEEGALPPAQVCVQPAELAQDRSGWGRLSLLGLLERCVKVGDGGHYRIDGMLPGRWIVAASAEGYVPVQHEETPAQPWISLQIGQIRDGLDLTLRVRGVPVRGVVRDVAGGTIGGAVVTDGQFARVLTDDDGKFTLWSEPHSSSVIVAAYAAGYAQDVVVARPPRAPVTLYLTPESVLRGRVVRSDTDAPVAGSAVHLRNPELADAETAADGSFEIRGLTPGRHKPYVRGDGWCGSAEPSVALGIGETSEPITITARPCRTLSASVRVRPSGEGCPSAQIELLDAAGDVVRRAITDATGSASVSGLEPGAYDVRIRCPGRLQRAPEPWVLGEAMRAEAVWYVELGRTLTGRVLDHRGAAVPRAKIDVVGSWGYVNADTNDRGEFVATGIHPGSVTVTPYHPQHGMGVQREIEIQETSDPSPVTLEFSVLAEASVSGRLRARKGTLPPGLTVAAYAIGNFAARSVGVDEDGRFTIPGLQRLPHRIVVQRAAGLKHGERDGQLAELVVDLEQRETAEADFVLDIEGMIALSGHVENADRSAEPDAFVTVSNPMIRHRALTDEAGRFTVEVPGDTTYTIEVTARDGTTLKEKDVKPGAPITLRLAATRRVCGVVEADVPITGDFTIDTDLGGGETFGGHDARWCLSQVPVGTRTLTARSQLFGAARRTLEITAQGDVPEVSLRFAGRTSLRGRVLDGAGEPRAGLKIWVFDPTGRLVGGNLYTDAAGEFAVDGVPAGELTVVPILPGPFPGRDELMARGTRVQVSTERPTNPVLLSVP